MFACCHFYYRLQLLLIIIHITCISLSLRITSAPIHLTSVLGVLGTQETFCILTAGLLESFIFDLYLPEFDIPWVIHLRKTCCCSTSLWVMHLHLKYGRYMCIVQTPGSIHLHTQFTMNITTLYQYYTNNPDLVK